MKNTKSGTTSIDVALLAGVSQSAVSRAFTPGSSISKDKRTRILEAARKLNYIPNSIASSLITRRSNAIAVVLGDIGNPFYLNVLKAFIEKLQAKGKHVFTFTVEIGSSSDDIIMQVLRHQVDGIVLTSAQLSTQTTSICLERGIPIVLFNRYVPGSGASVVRCDNEAGGKALAEILLSAGAKTFTIIKGDPMGTTSQDRVKGFSNCLHEKGINPGAIHEIEGNSVYDTVFNAICKDYGENETPLPDAFFGVNDLMAMAAIDALRYELKMRVPEDVMVCGFDGIPEGRRSPYQLTTVRQPIEEMVDETLKLLNLDQENSPPDHAIDRVITGTLIKRETVRT